MFSFLFVMVLIGTYSCLLFLVALWAEKKARQGCLFGSHRWFYALSLAVYCTSWSFLGGIGKAATSGMLFVSVYLGATLSLMLWWTVARKLVRIKERYHIATLSDLISVRYDRSTGLAVLVTIVAVLGVLPYVALQLRSVISGVEIFTGVFKHSAVSLPGVSLGIFVVALMIGFSILLGARRLEYPGGHQGMITVIVVENVVQLAAFLTAGIFIVFFKYHGLDDIFTRIAQHPEFASVMKMGFNGSPFLWITYMILSMSAVLLLPRQFHLAVVENTNEKHILTALWVLPAFMLLLTFFVFPLSLVGMLHGYGERFVADTYLFLLPLDYGNPLLALFVLIGAFSAATAMVMLCSMTVSTMVTNHLIVPVVDNIKEFGFLKRHLLSCRWLVIAGLICGGYWFEGFLRSSFPILDTGLIAFACIVQLAPIVIGGLFWQKANRQGAFMGLIAGVCVWGYTLIVPLLAENNQLIPYSVLSRGPWGLGFLNPYHLFGVTQLNPISHGVFWSLVCNCLFYVLGSLWFAQSSDEAEVASHYVHCLSARGPQPMEQATQEVIETAEKTKIIREVLSQYFPEGEAQRIVNESLSVEGLAAKSHISVLELAGLYARIEKRLSDSVGVVAATKALKKSELFTPHETEQLSRAYSKIITDLKLPPEELKKKVDYYQEREKLVIGHAIELEAKVKALEQSIAERKREEERIAQLNRTVLKFGIDPMENIQYLLSDARELFAADYVAYARLRDEMVQSIAATADGNLEEKVGPEGTIEHHVMQTAGDDIVELHHLGTGSYAAGDPKVRRWGLSACFCQKVKLGDEVIGIVILAFRGERMLDPQEKKIFGILASSVAIEKNRWFAEQSLKQSEERYKTITSAITDYIFTVTMDHGKAVRTTYGPACIAATGYSNEEFLIRPFLWLDIVHQEDIGIVHRQIDQIYSGKDVDPIEHRIIRKDGSVRWIRNTVVLHHDAGGTLLSYDGLIRDITGQKVAEEALRESQRQLATLMSNLPGMVYRCLNEKSWPMSFMSDGCRVLTGYDPEDFTTGKTSFNSLIHPDDREYVWDQVQKAVAEKQFYRIMYRIRTAEGAERYVWEQGQGIFKDATLLWIEGFIIDITERKYAEEQVVKQNRFLNNVLESLKHPFYVIDTSNYKIVMANSSTGFNERLHETPCYQLIHGHSSPCAGPHLCPLEEIKITKAPVVVEHVHYDSQGNRRDYEVHGYPVFDASGSVVQMIEYSLDITERKRAVEQLNQTLNAMDTIMENMPFGVMIIGRDKKIRQVNKAALRMMGAPSEREVIGNRCHQFVCPSKEDECPLLDLHKPVTSAECSLIAFNGKHIPILKTVLPIFLNSEEVLLEAFVDISVQKKTEELLVQAKQHAEDASKIKSQFLANMSHEIRTPLNAIIGFSQLMDNTKLDAVQNDYANTINSSAELLLMLINDILDVTKIEAGEVRLESIDFDLDYLVRSVMKMSSAKLLEKNIDLLYVTDENIPRRYKGDPTRIRQILMNLIGNAIKFTEQGEILVSVQLEDSLEEGLKKTHVLRFTVKDSGIGIPKDKQGIIFEAFEQADASTTRKFGGTGLGLTICRALVEMMGGRIRVESDMGKGSSFIFTLKLEEASSNFGSYINYLKMDQLKGKKVAIVDDNANALLILDIYCRELEMEVVYKGLSPKKALEWLSAHNELPDIVISDIIMRELDGYSFVKSLRADPRYAHVKICAVTGDVSIGIARRLRESGFDAYLSKPILKEEFVRTMQVALGIWDESQGQQLVTRHSAAEVLRKGLKVLVAEDNPVNMKLMQMLLKSLECLCDSASNGQEAVEKLKANDYDIVLMDLQMPVMGGIEATNFIRTQMKKSLPIIALTAAAMKEDEQRSLAAGMNDFVTKPVSLNKLKEKIMQWTQVQA